MTCPFKSAVLTLQSVVQVVWVVCSAHYKVRGAYVGHCTPDSFILTFRKVCRVLGGVQGVIFGLAL